MLKNLLYISLLFILAGCGSALNESWTNFRAYYNTYYNAELNFEAGVDKVHNQEVEMEIDRPIRVHPKPVNAGDQDFAKAIEKGAQILRKFPESRWIDETLELIGKSYYYRQEYYSALQKFEEQYNVTESSQMRQRSVIWKARVLLELELHEEGILFLEEELEKLADEWEAKLQGEAEVLMAEHYAQLRNWEEVQNLLSSALNKLERGPLKARAHFLYGQILEEQGRLGEAHFAYSNVALNLPEFELLYWAQQKQGETLRQMGNLEQASAIYESMRKDDKNVQRLSEINYEIARTEEEKGNVRKAEKQYIQILRNRNLASSPSTRAKTYYRLGTIYKEHYRNYQLAASYFDSSSTFADNTAGGQFEENLDAEDLARAYGEYATIRGKIERIDSLLWLGSLSRSRFDSVIAEVRQRKLQNRNENQQGSSNVLTNVGADARDDGDGSSSGVYGFLNHRNSSMVADARTQFRAVWGSRALVDDWRRIEAVRNQNTGDSFSARSNRSLNQAERGAQDENQVLVDISEVPFSEEQKNQMRGELATARYELGNLFLLTLQMPDSAARYFNTVISQHPDHALVPKALYSLFEVYWSTGTQSEAEQWAERLREEYPNSVYTDQVNQRLGVPRTEQDPAGEENLQTLTQRLLASTSSPSVETAEALRSLALAYKESDAAPRIHYEAVRQYIDLAKQKNPPVFASRPAESDSATATLQGSYEGVFWDSVRVVLEEYGSNFSGGPDASKVSKLSEALSERSPDAGSGSIKTCRDIGAAPRIKSGIDNFLAAVVYPEEMKEMNVSGEVTFEFILKPDGTLLSYQLRSKKTGLGIEEAFEKAIEEQLEFLPLEISNPVEKVRCEISFPVKQ